MTPGDQAFIFVLIVIGALIAVGLTLIIARAFGLAKRAPMNATSTALTQLRQRIPEMNRLPDAEQQRIARAAATHPLVLGPAVAILALFVWVAIGNNALLDLINSSWRIAGFIGVVLLAAILVSGFFLREFVAKRMVRRALTEHGLR